MTKTPKEMEIRKQMSIEIVSRLQTLELKSKEAEKVARNMFLGASNLALLLGNKELAHMLHNTYITITETGTRHLYKWAGLNEPISEEDKEAA